MKIVLTGGGTAGHVVGNLALMPGLQESGFEVSYIGGKDGMEKGLVEAEKVPYYGISSGKLRRYLSLKNLTDAARVLKGVADARKALKKIKPDVVFSKGGFVTVPVVYAAKTLKIPVVIHESDITVGLANKLALRHASKICCVFPETMANLPSDKAIHTGTPLRREIFGGSSAKGLEMCGFTKELPVIMVMGGSSGSVAINTVLHQALPHLEEFNIIHICGKGNADKTLESGKYRQFEYVSKGMGDLYAASQLVISRAGSNSLAELLALHKPNVLIPLPKQVSRGDQILNAQSFEKQGFSVVLDEDGMDANKLSETIKDTYTRRSHFKGIMSNINNGDGTEEIIKIIKSVAIKS
ncbi:MAG: undecaprenyldiphospho-muramoylpentapeptide beta-N-acetylglucosaminyltransferase [Defluviitaleaceae bacterium]|nr:undecaprenyldiphospho-muramoylpentapeptide beta-N-acetylglucosaminyltransferase [Defluviitaleaceae bacterium]